MTAPQRIQRKRTKGWRLPPNTVYVGRPGRFGNPFDWTIYGHEGAVDFFQRWLADDLTIAERQSSGIDLPDLEIQRRMKLDILGHLDVLKGKDLACWCSLDKPCHADVLLDLANKR